MKIVFSEKYYEMVPRPTKDEWIALDNSIRLNGLQEPIVINQKGVILDGYTRYEICRNRKITPKTRTMKFDNEIDETRYVLETNATRRQLNAFQKVELFMEIFMIYRQQAYDNKCNSNYTKRNFPTGKSAAERYGELIGVGKTRVKDAFKILNSNRDDLKVRCRNGTLSINEAKKLISGRVKKEPLYKHPYPSVKKLIDYFKDTQQGEDLKRMIEMYNNQQEEVIQN